MGHLLAFDAGTTGVRAMLVGDDGSVVAKAYREFPQHFPRPGWVEHEPEDWWQTSLTVAEGALSTGGVAAADLAAVGITNQRETTALWERDSLRPVHPAIVWQDRRTTPLCETLRNEGWTERIREHTGLVIDPYFSATKVEWLLANVTGAREAAEAGRLAFGTVDSYLLARLTGGRVHATDRTNASRTMVFDIHQLKWDDELLERMRIPRAILPEVRPSAGEFGETDPEVFFGARVPISGIAGDQQASLFGQACFEPGETKNTYGTGSFVLMNTGARAVDSTSGLLTTVAAGADGDPVYALEGSIFVTGAAIQWLRDGLGLIRRADEAGPLAASVPDAGGVCFVPALTGLGAPWWNPRARGTITGITRGTTRAHLVRATVEAIAYQTRAVVDAMRDETGLAIPFLRVDGGASAMDVLLQLQAEQLRAPVVRSFVQETTALGAAYLAGLGRGVWGSRGELVGHWRAEREFASPGDRIAADEGYARWRRAVERSLDWDQEAESEG